MVAGTFERFEFEWQDVVNNDVWLSIRNMLGFKEEASLDTLK